MWIVVVGYISCTPEERWDELCIPLSYSMNTFIPCRLILGIGVTFVLAGIGILLLFGAVETPKAAGEGDHDGQAENMDDGQGQAVKGQSRKAEVAIRYII